MKITRPKRYFVREDFEIKTWKDISFYFEKLISFEVKNVKDLENLLKNRSELDSILEEDFAWKYIKMNGDTKSKSKKEIFEFFVKEIQPKLSPLEDELNKKITQNFFFKDLPDEKYKIYKRGILKSVELFEEKNIPLFTEIGTLSQKFGVISGDMNIEFEGETLTLQQASVKLKNPKREIREAVYKKISKRRLEDKNKLDELFDNLLKLRHNVAKNAGFKNFRDYKFKSMGRFDYTVEDCKKFHQSVKTQVVPLVKKINEARKNKLGLEVLKPWDLSVDISGKEPLKPFSGSDDLIEKTIKCFTQLDPYFGECIEVMKDLGHFDLESRKGKAPGGFNYPLYEIGVPFIYMNSVDSHRDLETIVHEGGHALHSFYSRNLELCDFKSCPSEVAELASMSMELISMEHWDEFYNPEDLTRAIQEKLEDVILSLPSIAKGDEFQHWIYENPNQTSAERHEKWQDLNKEYSTGIVEFKGFEENYKSSWQGVLHFYEVPFYYIEYGFSQLGAVGMWKNFKENKSLCLQHYKNFMKLGYTKTIPEIYKTAGIEFDFSEKNIQKLMEFVERERDN